MLWLKAWHIIFMVTWFAGLFYLPRLFIYHVEVSDPASDERFIVMERRLFAIMSIGAILTALFGLSLIAVLPAIATSAWFQLKLVLVAVLVGYHLWCLRLMRALARGERPHGQRWLRWFNEAPALALIGIVILAVVKPF